MKSLFINTSSFFMSIVILDNDKIIYKCEEEIRKDMASKIIPYIEFAFSKASFGISDIDKIFIVTGPGSFTGIRVGVTAAKTISWALKKDIIPISSLECLATTNCNAKYRIPMIDARRGYVYAGVYDENLNCILPDKYILKDDLNEYFKDGQIISYDDFPSSILPNPDISTLIEMHKNDVPLNPHDIKPNYLKLTEAEEKNSNS